ncbi:unnamed protein product [Dibothriocephalus latus]|uniref:Uncharacterized protein n=1 Tax=Dibothriocephalus latus TaxID=60516 RepID=A0A3P7P249_DIBLA|nr:unnamed protein product [Dibothriocephalus latus]
MVTDKTLYIAVIVQDRLKRTTVVYAMQPQKLDERSAWILAYY